MKTIAIASLKGGSGKSTLALNLGVAAFLNKKQTVLIDLDPQCSLTSWADNRENKLPDVLSVQALRLAHILETAKDQDADIVIIDTGGDVESTALTAIRNSDLVLIPCRSAIFDLQTVKDTFNLTKIADKTAFVILNAVPATGALADEAETAILEQGIEVSPWRLTQRIAFVYAATAGLGVQEYEPNGKAALEVKNLYRWVLKQAK
ncbi:MAG: AAA family ATPase [Nostoc sp.]